MGRSALSFLAMFALAAYSRRISLVRLFVVGLSVAVIFIDAKHGQAQDVSIPFLRETCFLMPWQKFRHDYGVPGRESPRIRVPSVLVRIRNPSWDRDARICVYDNICQEIRYRGRLYANSAHRVKVCANRNRRASIIILEVYGRALLYNNVRTGTLILPIRHSRR